MAKWNVTRTGPNWLMNVNGQVIGYKDNVGGEFQIPQISGSWGNAELISAPAGGVKTAVDASGNVTGLVGPSSEIIALSEVTPYVNRTTTGTAFTGACEYAGYVCTVAAGNITVYDNTSAAGTVIVPATALVVGAFPIFGAGTNGKMALVTGCHVVLSGAATVNILVQ